MKYQLSLQFPGESLEDCDLLIALEVDLIEELADAAKVDGPDFGSGEINIFIYANEPEKIFNRIKPALAKQKLLASLVAAYRQTTGEDYTVLWPVGFNKQFNIT